MKFFLILLLIIILSPVLLVLIGSFLPSKTVTNYEQAMQKLPFNKDKKKED